MPEGSDQLTETVRMVSYGTQIQKAFCLGDEGHPKRSSSENMMRKMPTWMSQEVSKRIVNGL